MNILVTGGNGFVGQHLVKMLSKNHNVIVLCRKRHETMLYDIERIKNVSVIYRADITDYKNIEQYFENIDVVFHLAGMISFLQKDRKKLISTNYYGTLNVLKACEEHKVKKLIYLSSTAVYGFSKKIIDEQFRFPWNKEKHRGYSYSKFLPEDNLLLSKVPVVIISPPMIIGPGDFKVLEFLSSVKKRKIPCIPSGRNSVVDVRDLVTALILGMEKGEPNQKYIVMNENHSYKEIGKIAYDLMGVPLPKITIPKFISPLLWTIALWIELIFKDTKISYENIYFTFRDRRHSADKIKKLGYRPKYSLEDSFRDAKEYLEERRLL